MKTDSKDSQKATKRSPLIRYLRNAGVFFVALAVFLSVLAASAVFLINTNPVKNLARDIVNKSIPGTISWDTFDIILPEGQIYLKNLLFADEDQQEIVRLGSAEIKLVWQPLLRKELHLTLVVVNSPDIRIDLTSDEKVSDSEEQPSQATVLPVNIRIDTLMIRDGKFALNDKAANLAVRLGNINIKADQFNLADQTAALEVALSESSVRFEDHITGIDRFESSAKLVGGDLASFWVNLQSSSGAVEARGSGNRIFDRPSLKLSLKGEKLKVPFKEDLPDFDLLADGEFEKGRLSVSLLQINGLGSILNGKGVLDVDPLLVDAHIDLKADTISHVAEIFGIPAEGAVDFTAAVSGPLEQPRVDGKLNARGLKFDRFDVGDAQIQLRLDSPDTSAESTLIIEKLVIRNDGAKLDAEGKIEKILTSPGAVNKNPGLALSFSGSRVPIENFLSDAKGKLDFSGTVSGTILEPAGVVEAEIKDGAYDNQPIERVYAKAEAAGEKIVIPEITALISPGAEIRGSGWVSLKNSQYNATITARDFPLEAVKQVEALNIGSGKADVRLTTQGTFDAPEAKAAVKVQDLVIHSKSAPSVKLDLHLKDQLLTAAVDFGLTGKGSLHLDTKSFEFLMDMNRVDLAHYLAMAGKKEFSGVLDGRIEMKGNLEQIKETSGVFKVSHLVLNHKEIPLVETDSLDITYEKGTAVVRDAMLRLAGKGELKLGGSVRPDGPANLNISGELPMDIAYLFLEDIGPVSGRALLSASVAGSLFEPVVSGLVELDQVGITIPGLEQAVSGITGKIKLVQDEVEVRNVNGRLGGGTFSLNGKMSLQAFAPESFDAVFAGQNIQLEVPEMMDISLNSDLHLKGTLEQSMLRGEIILLDGQYYKDVSIDIAGMARPERSRERLVPAEKSSVLENMQLDIDVRDRQPFMIDNNLAELNIRAHLNLQGNAASMIINGRAQVDSGTVFFQKKEFEVKKGIFDFVDPYSNEPDIDIEAETEIRTWTVGLTVSGKPDNLDFKFYSNPQEEHADIISLLTLGKTTRELRKSEGGSNFSTAQILSALMGETVQSSVQEAAGLDSVEIELENDEETNRLGGRVTFGKELSRQMNVKYGVGMKGGETVHTVTSEYKILENFLMSGFQDSGGDFGGGVKFRLEFR